VRRNLVHFNSHRHDFILILSGDQLYRMDFSAIVDQHIATGADVTIAAIPFPISKVEGLGLMRVADDLSIFRVCRETEGSAVINSLAISPALERRLAPATEKRCLASMGIYVFSREVLRSALANSMKDFGKEVIPGLLGKARLCSYIFEGIGRTSARCAAFFEANLALAQPLPPFNFFDRSAPIYTHPRYLPASKINRCDIDHVVIGDGCLVTDSTSSTASSAIRSILGENSNLEDVVMMGADYYQTKLEVERTRRRAGPRSASAATAASATPFSTRTPASATAWCSPRRARRMATTPRGGHPATASCASGKGATIPSGLPCRRRRAVGPHAGKERSEADARLIFNANAIGEPHDRLARAPC